MTILQKIANFLEDALRRADDPSFVVSGFGEYVSVYMFDRPGQDEGAPDDECEIDPNDYLLALGL